MREANSRVLIELVDAPIIHASNHTKTGNCTQRVASETTIIELLSNFISGSVYNIATES